MYWKGDQSDCFRIAIIKCILGVGGGVGGDSSGIWVVVVVVMMVVVG